MGYSQTERRRGSCFVHGAIVLAMMLLLGSECRAQNAKPDQRLETPWSQELSKYPGLTAEFARLIAKLQQNVQFPAERHESKLLPLLPPSTVSYAAFSNYGDAADQTLKIFHQELAESAVLRDWWAHGQLASA